MQSGRSKTKSKTGRRGRRSQPRRGSLTLRRREVLGRRFVEFPGVKGKTLDRIELFTSAEHHCITLDFRDRTLLNLAIEPGFTIRAELEQREKGETRTLAKWPEIQSRGATTKRP
jgi:hypothetical protein